MSLISIQAFKCFLTEEENSNNLTSHCESVSSPLFGQVREGTFFIGVGGPGLRRGGSLVHFLQIGEGQSCFILNRGRVAVFLARKKLLQVASILYIQAKLPVKINPNYLKVSKIFLSKNYLLPTNIIVSLDLCPLSPRF